MTGLATKAQMTQLANAHGRDLDRLFTRLMILHHEGGVHALQGSCRWIGRMRAGLTATRLF